MRGQKSSATLRWQARTGFMGSQFWGEERSKLRIADSERASHAIIWKMTCHAHAMRRRITDIVGGILIFLLFACVALDGTKVLRSFRVLWVLFEKRFKNQLNRLDIVPILRFWLTIFHTCYGRIKIISHSLKIFAPKRFASGIVSDTTIDPPVSILQYLFWENHANKGFQLSSS